MIDQEQLSDNYSGQISEVIGSENDSDQYSYNYTNQDQVAEGELVGQDQSSINSSDQGNSVNGYENYVIEDVEADTNQSQVGSNDADQSQSSSNGAVQSGVVNGANNDLDQYLR